MDKYGKWQVLDLIGKGGQGSVYKVIDAGSANIDFAIAQVAEAGRRLGAMASVQTRNAGAVDLLAGIVKYLNGHHKALKLLNEPADSTGFGKQLGRMKYEVAAMRKLNHSSIVRLVDHDLENGWFVMDLFSEGTLAKHLDVFRGDFLAALKGFRPIVEAVAKMHETGLVHRDIKPENVFFSSGRLVLGDLGLVHFADAEHSRFSDTFENVGSRDWMPGWAMGMRLEDLKPSFDVFSLGKLLWSMVSGKPKLQLWYHHKESFELEHMFPDNTDVLWARRILDLCIVEEEQDCLANARKLLEIVDTTLNALGRHSQIVAANIRRTCRVCGLGHYASLNQYISTMQDLFDFFVCGACGHTELLLRRGRPK